MVAMMLVGRLSAGWTPVTPSCQGLLLTSFSMWEMTPFNTGHRAAGT